MYPLSFAEFSGASNLDFDDAWDDYQRFGGMPALLNMMDDRQKAEYLRGLFNTVYLRDVVERNHLQNIEALEALVNVLASGIGSLTNPMRIANTFASQAKVNISPKTVSAYIKSLADAFLVSAAERYDVKGRKYIGSNKKYYFVDVGLRNARLDFRQLEPTHIMENLIYNELRARGYLVDVGNVEENDKKDGVSMRRQLEIDFVATRGGERCYVQCAYSMDTSEKAEQEKRSLLKIDDGFKKVIITRESAKPWQDENGFVIMGLRQFLKDPESLKF